MEYNFKNGIYKYIMDFDGLYKHHVCTSGRCVYVYSRYQHMSTQYTVYYTVYMLINNIVYIHVLM